MRDSDRYDTNVVANELAVLAKSLKGYVVCCFALRTVPDRSLRMESAHFHSGHFQDECYKTLGAMDRKQRRDHIFEDYLERVTNSNPED